MSGFANPLRRLWTEGRSAANGWIACPSVLSAEALASAGWDSITVDMQHGTADYAVALKKTPPFTGALRAAWRKGSVTSDDRALNAAIAGEDDELITALATGHHRTRRGVYDLLYRALRACGLEVRNP